MLVKLWKYILNQLDKPTAWIGIIGIGLQLLGLQSVMFVLFLLLVVLPESHFSDAFKVWTQKLREMDEGGEK